MAPANAKDTRRTGNEVAGNDVSPGVGQPVDPAGDVNAATTASAEDVLDAEGVRDGERDGERDGVRDGELDGQTLDAQALDDQALDAQDIDEIEEELDELGKALAEADELRDRYVRLQAEWDNFRKRTAAERVQERTRAAENLMERLLPIVDDLERAIEHSDTANEVSLKEGIAAVYSKLSEVLAREGLKALDPVGAAFDANLHQAVGKVEDASVPDETVTQVYQKGYEMGGRVLRPAMVVVSHGGPRDPEKPAPQA